MEKFVTHCIFFVFPQVKMGLLVDLTNTTRFYDRNDIEKEGVKYVKLQCKGYEHIHCHKLTTCPY